MGERREDMGIKFREEQVAVPFPNLHIIIFTGLKKRRKK
jgi:hypothetical protein